MNHTSSPDTSSSSTYIDEQTQKSSSDSKKRNYKKRIIKNIGNIYLAKSLKVTPYLLYEFQGTSFLVPCTGENNEENQET